MSSQKMQKPPDSRKIMQKKYNKLYKLFMAKK